VVSKNHVHILVNAPPTIAASEIIPLEEFPHLKKR